jgi:curli biogenesis system outer membrane secretion channel CsgG
MRLMRFILVFSLSLFALPETSQAQISYKNVSAQGVGVNLNNAINAALVEAISQVNGKSVESQQVLKTLETIKEGTSGNNYALQEDYAKQVATKTKGAIKSYTIEQQSRTADGRFQVTVNAQVAIYKRAKSSNRKRIALMPLRTRDAYRVNGANLNPLAVSEIVGQAVVDNLVSSRRFTVLDRDYMAELLSEEQLIQSSRVPVEEMARLGQTLAADMIFVGTLDHLNVGKRSRTMSSGRKIEYLEGQAQLSYRIIDVATKQIKFSKTQTITIDQDSLRAEGLVGFSSVENVTIGVSKVVGLKAGAIVLEAIYPTLVVSVMPNELVLGEGGDKFKPGTVFDLFALGKKMIDPYTKESLGRSENKIGTITITRGTSKQSYATYDVGGYNLVENFKPKSFIVRSAPQVSRATVLKKKVKKQKAERDKRQADDW